MSMVGRKLSHYEIREEIGRGGMGIVYRAHDVKLNRDVALKVLPPDLVSDPERRRRFIKEAQAAAALQHPNVAVVYEIGEDDATTFIAMELIAGEKLSSWIARGPVPAGKALPIVAEIAAGLERAHEKGVVHRDLKPANILISEDGHAKIIDFGLAKLLEELPEAKSDLRTAVRTDGDAHGHTDPGQVMGTWSYMSPEQLSGRAVDHRTDLFALGAVFYEMLTGERAFSGTSPAAITHAITNQEPPPAAESSRLNRVLQRALRKEVSLRYQTARQMLEDLEKCRESEGSGWSRQTVSVALALVVLLGAAASWLLYRSSRVRWARTEALPEVQRLADEGDYVGAVALAEDAEGWIPGDPALAELWPLISERLTVTTEPSGADVFIKEYAAVDEPWRMVGQTPLEGLRAPVGLKRLRIERDGYETEYRALPAIRINVELVELGSVPDGMVRVPALRNRRAWLAGMDPTATVDLNAFLIDRHEVSNREFQSFVDDGGYENESWWKHEFVHEGRPIDWSQAMEMVKDATGRFGPSTWQVGTFPKGQEEHPVSGVSWHEAAAYCESVGKHLPTIYHWITASGAFFTPADLVPLSNVASHGPSLAGAHHGMGPFGTYDTAGNVSEWCWNASGNDRYLLGGSWRDPEYVFGHAQVRDPFDRSLVNGFRCVRYLEEEAIPKETGKPIELVTRDYRRETPVGDDVFDIYREQFGYDATPLNAAVENNVASDEHWSVERVTLDAAYENDRLIVYVVLPVNASPPHQAVITFPGSGAINNDALEDRFRRDGLAVWHEFLVKSGRALVWPVYKSTYDRRDGLETTWPDTSRAYVDRVIDWVKDFRRTVDYLETRDDIDAAKLAYFGTSWGGRLGAIIPAVETRLKANVLLSGGLASGRARPEVDQINYITRVMIPTLMLNGRLDSIEPVAEAQLPMFELLGTPPEHKRHVLYDTGHLMPVNSIIRETLDWLDRYLGPVGE